MRIESDPIQVAHKGILNLERADDERSQSEKRNADLELSELPFAAGKEEPAPAGG